MIFYKKETEKIELVARPVRDCSATSMHWMAWSFSRKTGMASTMTELDLGRASIM